MLVNDTLPPGVTFIAAPGCTFVAPSRCVPDRCAGEVGATAVRTITVTVDPSALDGSLLTNTAFVDGIYSDPNLGNNFALAFTNVARGRRLAAHEDRRVSTRSSPASQLTYTLERAQQRSVARVRLS